MKAWKRINIFEFIDKVKRNVDILILLIFSSMFLFAFFITKQPISLAILLLIVFSIIIVWGAFFLPDKNSILEKLEVRKPNLRNKKEKKLMEIVEELSIALGIKKPEVYLIESDEINAFIAGRSVKNSCLCITDKAVNELNEEELSALVAHGLVRIKNNDARLVIISFIVAFGMFLISLFILLLVVPILLTNLIVMVVLAQRMPELGIYLEILGFIFIGLISILLQLFVVKERVILADTEAVKLTNNPEALSNLLKKIKNINKESSTLGSFEKVGWIGYLFFVFPKEIKYKKSEEEFTTNYTTQETTEEESESISSTLLWNVVRALPSNSLTFYLFLIPIMELSHTIFSPLYSAVAEMKKERSKKTSKKSSKRITFITKKRLIKTKENKATPFYPTIDERIEILESL
jgi:heat shock protein HtpX